MGGGGKSTSRFKLSFSFFHYFNLVYEIEV